MARTFTRLLALACGLAALDGCTPERRQPAPPPPAPVARREAPPPPRSSSPSIGEESLGGARPSANGNRPGAPVGPEGGADDSQAQPVAPHDPEVLLALIGPTTSPQRAASLRLTDAGRRMLDSGDTAGALDRIEKAVKVDPTNPHGYYWLAQVHLRNGRLDQALAFSDKSIVLFSQGDRTWLAQAYTFRASILEKAGRFPEARSAYRRAVQAEPGNVAARAGLGRLGEPEATLP